MKVFVWLAIFLIIGGYLVVKVNNLDMDDPKDRATFIGKFWLWIKGTSRNVAGLAGEAAKKDWLPSNATNSTK